MGLVWTYRLIPNIEMWLNRNHGETNYCLTQFFTGHGDYRKYLFRFRIDESPFCPACPELEEDPEHVLFYCPRFIRERERFEVGLNSWLTVETFISKLVESVEEWNLNEEAIVSIHNTLKCTESDRRSMTNIMT